MAGFEPATSCSQSKCGGPSSSRGLVIFRDAVLCCLGTLPTAECGLISRMNRRQTIKKA